MSACFIGSHGLRNRAGIVFVSVVKRKLRNAGHGCEQQKSDNAVSPRVIYSNNSSVTTTLSCWSCIDRSASSRTTTEQPYIMYVECFHVNIILWAIVFTFLVKLQRNTGDHPNAGSWMCL